MAFTTKKHTLNEALEVYDYVKAVKVIFGEIEVVVDFDKKGSFKLLKTLDAGNEYYVALDNSDIDKVVLVAKTTL